MKKLLFFVLVLALVALPALAQVQYGTVTGTVIDNQQQALPGVSVTLAGPAMQGRRTQVTDTAGFYRFVPVPPGSGYTLKFELSGFTALEQSGILVNVGKDTTISAQMAPSEFAETITVTADRVVIDTSKSTVDTNVDWKLIDNLSTNRHYNAVFQTAPGVQMGQNNPTVNGAAGDDNAILLDGVDTTDPRTGTWGTQINYDTIAEVQVQTGGYQAEFGRAIGGVLNLVTKSGGNEFHFTGRVVQTDTEWAASPGIDDERNVDKTGAPKRTELRPNITIGGPIAKDKLWFYFAYEQRDRDTTLGRYSTIEDAEEGIQTEDISNYKGHFFSGKLTLQASDNHSLSAYYNEDPIDISNINMVQYGGPYINSEAENIQTQGGFNGSLMWYGVLSPSFFMEAKYQLTRQALDYFPQSYEFWGIRPQIYDYDTGYTYNAPWDEYKSARDRDGILLTGSQFLETGNGSHQIKAGVEWLEVKPNAGDIYNPAGYYETYGGEPYDRYFYTEQIGAVETKDQYMALFVQDNWKIGKLTINAGIRAESYTAKNNVGTEVMSFGLGDQIAPRLGFAYDLNGDVLRASLGRFYDLPSNYISATLSSTPVMYESWLWNGSCTYNGDPAGIHLYPDSCWDLDYRIPVGEAGASVDPSLDPIYMDEIMLGYEKMLSSQFAAGLTYVWREQPKGIDRIDPEYDGMTLWTNTPVDSVTTADGRTWTTNNKWKEYQALQLSFRKAFGPDGFQFMTSYSYVLKTRGWSGAGGTASSNSYSQAFASYGNNYESFNDLWYGELESPHLFKFFGSWTAPWRMTVGLNAWWTSGNVYTRYTPRAGARGNLPLEQLGSSEVGDNWEADVHLEQAIKLGPVDLAVYVDAFNVFNNQQPTGRGAASNRPATYNLPTAWQSPRQLQWGFKIEF